MPEDERPREGRFFEASNTHNLRNSWEIARKGGRKQGPRVIKHLFEEIAPRYAERPGGYARIAQNPAAEGDDTDAALDHAAMEFGTD